MRRLHKYFALPPAGRAIVLRSLLLLLVVTALIRARGMGRTRAWLERLAPRTAAEPSALAPSYIASLVGATASLLRARCLARSLVLWHFLRERSSRAEVRIGVTKLSDGSLSAHAWVDFDGVPLNDAPELLERYAVLPSRVDRFRASRTLSL